MQPTPSWPRLMASWALSHVLVWLTDALVWLMKPENGKAN